MEDMVANCEVNQDACVGARLRAAIVDLKAVQKLLLTSEFDGQLLADFRDAINRVRNVAWAAQQSMQMRESGEDPSALAQLLAGERVRAAYQLCSLIREDLNRNDIDLQKGQLTELTAVAGELVKDLKARVG